MTKMTAFEQEREGGACRCGQQAEWRVCDGCATAAWIIDCGHYYQPRPIAAGRDDGSELHRTFCDECACEASSVEVQ